MRKLIEYIKMASEKSGLYLNVEKTKIMSNQPLQHFTIGTKNIEVVQKFILLGSVVENEGDCRKEMARRLEQFPFSEQEHIAWAETAHPDIAPFHHDLYRGVGRGRFWVMEQQPGPVNWAKWNPVPKPGMIRLWTWEALAHGAEVNAVW